MAKHASQRVLRPSERRRRASRYVASLDGLRTFAVMAVIFYHMSLDWAPGGLMGVTVFFVISGYLINGLLVAEYDAMKTISLSQFWLRRVRRIIPAVLLALAGTLVLCALVSPTLFAKARTDLLPSLFFFNNWWQIFHNVSYFEAAAAPSPLTHYWSLAIEEQFYIVWPLLLLVLLKIRMPKKGISVVVGILAVASFVAMAYLYSPMADPSRIYYGTDTRAGSLLVGALLALVWPSTIFGHRRTQSESGAARLAFNVLGVAALAGLVLVIVFTNSFTSFPYLGGIALVSVLTALLIAVLVVPNTWVARLLQLRPLVWIGKRSYGMYLWHYPIILATSRFTSTIEAPWWVRVSQIIVIIAVADLSYRFVETPIRSGALHAWWKARRGAADENAAGRPARKPILSRTAARATVATCATLACAAAVALAVMPQTTTTSPQDMLNQPSSSASQSEEPNPSALQVNDRALGNSEAAANLSESNPSAPSESASSASAPSSDASSAAVSTDQSAADSAPASERSNTSSTSASNTVSQSSQAAGNAAAVSRSSTSAAAQSSQNDASSASPSSAAASSASANATEITPQAASGSASPASPDPSGQSVAAQSTSSSAAPSSASSTAPSTSSASASSAAAASTSSPSAETSANAASTSTSSKSASPSSESAASSDASAAPAAASASAAAPSASSPSAATPETEAADSDAAPAAPEASTVSAVPTAPEASTASPASESYASSASSSPSESSASPASAQAEEPQSGLVEMLAREAKPYLDEIKKKREEEAEREQRENTYEDLFETKHLNEAGALIFSPLLIGDSVAAGCENEFYRVFPYGHSDAAVNRNIWESPYQFYADNGQVGEYVVFCLGTNNAVIDEQVDEMLSNVGDDKKVILVNVRCPRDWEAQTNQALANAQKKHSNVVALVDWYNASAGHDEYFYEDGIHVNAVGAEAYVSLIQQAIQDSIE